MGGESERHEVVLILKVRTEGDPIVGEVGAAGELRPFRGWSGLATRITEALQEEKS